MYTQIVFYNRAVQIISYMIEISGSLDFSLQPQTGMISDRVVHVGFCTKDVNLL